MHTMVIIQLHPLSFMHRLCFFVLFLQIIMCTRFIEFLLDYLFENYSQRLSKELANRMRRFYCKISEEYMKIYQKFIRLLII
jgi:hypothetical protein